MLQRVVRAATVAVLLIPFNADAAIVDVSVTKVGSDKWVVTTTANSALTPEGRPLFGLQLVIGNVNHATANVLFPGDPGFENSPGGVTGNVPYHSAHDATEYELGPTAPSLFIDLNADLTPEGNLGPVDTPLDLFNFFGQPDATSIGYFVGFQSGIVHCSNGECTTADIAFRSPCGNGSVESGEQCDQGNVANGDCCSSACQFETLNGCCSAGTCQSGATGCGCGGHCGVSASGACVCQ